MTLTVCVGSSGSGKTTFLNDVHKSHKCTYIRQYHNLRPYIKVSDIPNFDPTKLPYWDIYMKEKKDKSIIAGGNFAGQFMAGLSGGQRKLLLFELIVQRTAPQDNLLVVLDEPFAGVTDDFVPFIVDRLNEMRVKHNILLVTNDHVETLKAMADNTVTVSAIDRNTVKVNGKEGVGRELALLAMSIGDDYKGETKNEDLSFFLRVEVSKNEGIFDIVTFSCFLFGLFLVSFWGSQQGSEALVLIAGCFITYFSTQSYFLQLAYWKVTMVEEAEALIHSSKSMNKFLKSGITMLLLFAVSIMQFGCTAAVMATISTVEVFVGIFFNNFADMVLLLLLGLYTDLTFQKIGIYGRMPFVLMVFFSTTFSPAAGLMGLKDLKYLFPRYYLWCALPEGAVAMEGCPENHGLLYLVLSSLLVPSIFVLYKGLNALHKNVHREKRQMKRRGSMTSYEFAELQMELFGMKALKNLNRLGSDHDLSSIMASSRHIVSNKTRRSSEDWQSIDEEQGDN